MLEREGGVVLARHLHPLGPMRFTVWNVIGQEVGPAVDARVTGMLVSGALGDETAEVFNEDVVPFLAVGVLTCGRLRRSVRRIGFTTSSYPKSFTDTAFWASKRPMSPSETGNAMPAMSSSSLKSA